MSSLLDSIAIVLASPAQRHAAWSLNSAHWRGPLTSQAFIDREAQLSQSALASGDGGLYFVAVPKDSVEGKGGHADANVEPVVYASCKALRKRVLVRRPGCAVEETTAYGIGSVYTRPDMRGRGLARYMLQAVQRELDIRGAVLSVLYSDIGRKFYADLGWVAMPARTAVMPISKSLAGEPEGVTWLSDEDLQRVTAQDTKQLHDSLATDASSPTARIAFLPDFAQLDWSLQRSQITAQALPTSVSQTTAVLRRRGAQTSSGTSWVWWDHRLHDGQLKILRLAVDGADATARETLLRAAHHEAAAWGLSEVVVWDPRGAEFSEVIDRDLGVPCLRWQNGEEKNIEWVCNEYYAWL
ncbi:hypothetical protein CFIMG_004049RA [Ceratocystis fimbriata CBS 114723]|uniref:LYC1 C-terminal domain-containing protein n=1 Tax=Ceratocystis fimbriata CBS 114723 TaxID=1035309 RepID=A0A2C5X1Q8_9PEZI|nr:hypothetical protein CFIMG_004049RA [Ceratocystis fimbriata CBS 114723]